MERRGVHQIEVVSVEDKKENLSKVFQSLFNDKDALIKQFGEKDASISGENFVDTGHPVFTMYSQDLDDTWNYSVKAGKQDSHLSFGKKNPITQIAFQLAKKDTLEDRQSELNFVRAMNSKKDVYLNLSHRFVSTKDVGIPGYMYLAKAEEYLRAQYSAKILDTDSVRLDVRQKKVLQFFLDNGYTVDGSVSKQVYEEIRDHRERFVELIVDHGDGTPLSHKEPYLLRSEILSNPDFIQHLQSDPINGNILVMQREDFLKKLHMYTPTVSLTKSLAES